MPIRLACHSDLEAITQIFTAAFWDEDVVGRNMHPHRNEYPQDVAKFWRARIQQSWWDWDNVLLVATSDDGKVVGAANWKRMGGWGGLKWWDPRRLLKYCIAAYIRMFAFLSPNRAANPMLLNVFKRAKPFFKHHWSEARAKVWSLENLGVSPKYQGRGYGKELTLWGLEQAQRDGVPASVVVADGKEEFYKICGFQEEVGNVTSGDENPMKEFKGGAILFKDPVR